MHTTRTFGRPTLLALLSLCLTTATTLAADNTNRVFVLEAGGKVEIQQGVRGARWITIAPNQYLYPGDRLRTGPNSRVTLLWSDASVARFGALTELDIRPPHMAGAEPGLFLFKGVLSFFHRGTPGRIRVMTRGAAAGIKGTEFVVAVEEETGRTTLSMIDGVVEVTDPQGQGPLDLTNRQQAVVEIGQLPKRTAGFIAENILQWCFYYPGVLDLRDLPLTADEQRTLDASLTAYRAGDLLAALTNYPAGRQPASEAERIYYAALLLSVGQVEQSEPVLADLRTAGSTRIQQLAAALRQLIAAVKGAVIASPAKPELASELLGASYYEQSRALGDESLNRALQLARGATTNSPDFGFAWARVAELEFSFGRIGAALDALEKSLALSPRNAQALALRGFLLAAQNKPREAIASFDQAIAVDAAFANAWLGRGLCRIRRGDLESGRQDLLVAAALEPRRAALRSYLGKAYGDSNDKDRALHELKLAKGLDDKDPTAWLYSALVKAEHNRINEAIRDLEHSQELNDNRSIYRSSLLLDQDRAVRSASLARIYHDAGMTDWSLFEAGRAVAVDYANYSAHLFLANSYDGLRDPNRINLRYETAAESEYLIANLLAPVGAGLLAQSVSQQEYFKLFERDRVGVSSFTEYLSRGAWTERGAQYGVWGNSSYLFEGFYRTDPGERRNGDFEERELRLHLKQQLTPQDSVYLRAIDYHAEAGDVAQYYDPAKSFYQGGPNPLLRTRERQEPALVVGYHREWSPGAHTLLLGGRFDDTYSVSDPLDSILIKAQTQGTLRTVRPLIIEQLARSTLELYSVEAQQIWQTPDHKTIVGGLVQSGSVQVQNRHFRPAELAGLFPPGGVSQNANLPVQRSSAYLYHSWQAIDSLLLVGGITYDLLKFPENFRDAPFSERQKQLEKLLPKAGFIWTPAEKTSMRFAYTRSLGGASVDQSIRLEPTQIAGLNQAFRSIIPESVAGANAGARFETYGLSLEQKFGAGTYLGLAGELLHSAVPRTAGAYALDLDVSQFVFASRLRERLNYRERALVFTVDQLIGDQWIAGGRYRLSDARLTDEFPEVTPVTQIYPPFQPHQRIDALLHQLNLHIVYNHPCGFFARFQTLWTSQENDGYATSRPGDEFWQLDAFAGYRFSRRRAQVTVGVLNLSDHDYRLNPLTPYNELARERTFLARLQLSF